MSSADGTVVGSTTLVNSGSPSDLWNLVLVAEGYQATEQAQFQTDADDFVTVLLATAPFDDPAVSSRLNVFRVDVTSTDSGADDPAACGGTGATPATYFDASFCNNGIQRLLVADSGLAADVVDDLVPEWHQILVIVNSAVFGGSGGDVAVTSTSGNWEAIAIHELGHSMFDLADEYEYYQGCGSGETDRDRYTGGEPAEVNVTTVTDRTLIKWGDLIDAATPVPTTTNSDCSQCDPQANPQPAGTVGAYEGAKYFHCGLFRPEFNCMMRTLGLGVFCAVCQRRIREVMGSEPPDGGIWS